MTRPLELLRDAARDEWSDPVFTAQMAIDGLLGLTEQNWEGQGLEAARMLRQARPDSPLILAVTETALDRDAARVGEGLARMRRALADRGWTVDLGLQIAHRQSLGVVSLATDVLDVLEAAARIAETTAELYTDRRAVARGLGYLGLPVEVAPPEEAEVLLLPIVAAYPPSVWLRERMVDVVLAASVRGKPVIPVAHPLTRLSPLNRDTFRPPPGCSEVRLPA